MNFDNRQGGDKQLARGNIRKRGNNSYQIRIYLGKNPDGSPNYHSETVRGDRTAAEQRLTTVLREIDTGGYVPPATTTLKEHMERWLEDWVAASDRSPKTVAAYRDAMKHILPELGHIPVQKLSAPQIQAYYRRKRTTGRRDGKGGLSATTVHGHHRTLHAALGVAVKWGLVARNVCDSVQPPQPKRQGGQTWTQDEVASFLAAAQKERLYALYALCMTTGLRRSEVTALRWADIDFDRLRISINQTLIVVHGKQQFAERAKSDTSASDVSISASVAEILKRHRARQLEEKMKYRDRYQDHDLVFCGLDGRPLWVENLTRRYFPRLCEKAEVRRIRFHDMRHSYASHLLDRGVPIPDVQRRMRHSRPSTTLDMYGHALPESERRAAEMTDDFLPSEEAEGST